MLHACSMHLHILVQNHCTVLVQNKAKRTRRPSSLTRPSDSGTSRWGHTSRNTFHWPAGSFHATLRRHSSFQPLERGVVVLTSKLSAWQACARDNKGVCPCVRTSSCRGAAAGLESQGRGLCTSPKLSVSILQQPCAAACVGQHWPPACNCCTASCMLKAISLTSSS